MCLLPNTTVTTSQFFKNSDFLPDFNNRNNNPIFRKLAVSINFFDCQTEIG